MPKPKQPPEFFFRMRTYRETSYVGVWLIRRQGAQQSVQTGLMHAGMDRDVAEKLFAALGVEPEIENSPYELEGAK